MRNSLIIVAAILALGACKPTEPKPTPTPTPTSALYPRPTCTGTVSAIHKRICENKSLDWLDRVLQKQWEEARKGAAAEKIKELDAAQAKFLAERDACKDDTCIAGVYKAYITPAAKPTKPAAKPVKKPPVAKPSPTPTPRWRPRGPGCVSQIGAAAAQRLSRQCDRVNPSRLCGVERSCGSLRRNIRRGCDATYDKPGFCKR